MLPNSLESETILSLWTKLAGHMASERETRDSSSWRARSTAFEMDDLFLMSWPLKGQKHRELKLGFACDLLSFVKDQAWFLYPQEEGTRTPRFLLFLLWSRHCNRARMDLEGSGSRVPPMQAFSLYVGVVVRSSERLYGTMHCNSSLLSWYCLLRHSIDQQSPGNPLKIILDNTLHSLCGLPSSMLVLFQLAEQKVP